MTGFRSRSINQDMQKFEVSISTENFVSDILFNYPFRV